ncbi:MAG: hypothetical protein QM754_13635 [Tepidisphaeraceae bacterium]
MPRGAKGWPIYSDERARGKQYATLFGLLGVAMPAVLGAICFFKRSPQQDLSAILVLFCLMIALCASLCLVLAFQSGRLKCTPSAILWVPNIGRPRWVWLAEAIRMKSEGGLFKFDIGRIVSIPKIRLSFDGSSPELTEKKQRTVNDWLDTHFAIRASMPMRQGWIDLAGTISYFTLTPALLLKVFKEFSPGWIELVHHYVGPLTPWQAYSVAGIFVIVSLICVLPVPLAIHVLLRHFPGTNSPKHSKWRLRREIQQGFEVQRPSGVSSAADSPIMPAP